jgi:iron complex outermembrane recepter protein
MENKLYKKVIVFSVSCILLSQSQSFALDEEEIKQNKNKPSKSTSIVTMDEVLVTSVPLQESLFSSAQPVSVLEDRELKGKVESSLGDTLSSEPGVRSSYFGPGAGRPVVRGLSGDRVKILQNGVGSQDVSNTSPDHAVALEPGVSQKIEVIRGPASLLYGTTAIGGVVNVLDNRIPEELPNSCIDGSVEIRGATNGKERATSNSINSRLGNLALHFDVASRKADEIDIPGFARTKALRDNGPELEFPEPKGKLPYSQNEANTLGIGTSYITEKGFVGLAGSLYNNEYGVPNGEKNISIDGRQPRFYFRTKRYNPLDYVESMDFKFGFNEYKHTEFEDGEVGTVFENRGLDSRYEIQHESILGLEGVLGFQASRAEFSALGEEAYQPPTDTDILSMFMLEKLPVSESFRFELGLRVDGQSTEATNYISSDGEVVDSLDKDFTTFSQSLGAVWNPTEVYAVALSLAHTERAPTGQELFANGPHIATAAFEVGDPTLDRERSLGLDLNLRKKTGLFTGFVGGFFNRFNDYIGLNPNGESEDDFPVYLYQAQDVDYYGFEGKIAIHLLGEEFNEGTVQDLNFYMQPDYVWAEDRNTDNTLPRIPPFRVRTGLEYKDDTFASNIEVLSVLKQNREAEFESETDGYTFLNLGLTKEVTIRGQAVELFLKGENLTNSKGREHVSFIKDVAPLPGANVTSGIRLRF